TVDIAKESNYYPFGLQHQGYNNTIVGRNHTYGFGNKEEQTELGLAWIDITARNYDPALGRWMNIDPLADQMSRHSPYNYAFDNPIYFIDPDGMAPTSGGKKRLHKSTTSSSGTVVYKNIVTHKGKGYKFPTSRNYEKTGWTFLGAGSYHEHEIPVEAAKKNFTGKTEINSAYGREGHYTGMNGLFPTTSPDYTERVETSETSVSGQYYNSDGEAVSNINEASSLVVTTNVTTYSANLEGGLNTKLPETITVTNTTVTTSYQIAHGTGVSGESHQLVDGVTTQTAPTIETMNFHNAPSNNFKNYAAEKANENAFNKGKQWEKFQRTVRDAMEDSTNGWEPED
ncbi:MAG: RHS repeat-associated core domain-containing protein, partial [Cyclobacteriaceae bacterium]